MQLKCNKGNAYAKTEHPQNKCLWQRCAALKTTLYNKMGSFSQVIHTFLIGIQYILFILDTNLLYMCLSNPVFNTYVDQHKLQACAVLELARHLLLRKRQNLCKPYPCSMHSSEPCTSTVWSLNTARVSQSGPFHFSRRYPLKPYTTHLASGVPLSD